MIDLIDTDPECTGDEVEAGDATCGGSQAGESAAVVQGVIGDVAACDTNQITPLRITNLANWVSSPLAIPGALAPGEVHCVSFTVFYSSSTPEASIQLAQSDLVQWRFAFDASVSE